MGLVLWMFLGFGLAMGGLIMFLQSGHQEAGAVFFVSGALLLMLPAVSIVSELAGILVFLGSYFFLIPAWRAYQTYREYKNRAVWGPLNEEETAAKEKAFDRLCICVILFALGIIAGFVMLCHDLAV